MEFFRSQVVRVFATIFVVLLCVDLAYRVEGVTPNVINVGTAITFTCHPRWNSANYNSWKRNGTLLADRTGVKLDDPRISQTYIPADYALSISNAKISDSANYTCSDYYGNVIKSYDLRVIGCSNCFVTEHSNPDKEKVICTLDNYWTEQVRERWILLKLDLGLYRKAVIQGNYFSFPIFVNEIQKLLSVFYLYIETDLRIPCMLSAELTTSDPSIFHPTTTLIPTTASKITTTLIQTTQNRRPTSTTTASDHLHPGTSIYHTPQNKNSNTGNNRNSNTTMIIAILGSIFIVILIIIIVVLQWKKMKDSHGNKHNGNVSITKEYPETCYESVKDRSGKGPEYATSIEKLRNNSEDQLSTDDLDNDGMEDNILYDSSDKIAESSISRMEGPLDNALYAMPDKRETISRESKSKVINGSSTSHVLYDNSVIINQHEKNKDTLQHGDHYENVEMPGPGSGYDAEEIALYAMPDKGPKRNTLKASPKAGKTSILSKDEVVDVDALYAEVDKTKKI